MCPRIARNMPTGIKAPEYRLARIGADAAPPMFAIEDMHSVNMSSRKMPEEEHDPDRIVDRVDDERTLHVDHRNVQRGLNLHDIVVAADPRAGECTERHPRVGAQMLLHREEGDDEPGGNRDGRREEAEQHARADAKNLADIRAQEHRENHRIGQERRKLAIDGLRCRHAPDAERSEQHRTDVDEDDAGDEAKDRPPRHPFGSKNHGREEHKDGDIGKSVGDHQIPPFLQKRRYTELPASIP